MRKRLFLIDGTALAYRSFFAFQGTGRSPLTTSSGHPTAATYGFCTTLRALIERMWATMYHARGVGLAATQVAVPLRLFVMDCSPRGDAPPRVCVNPELIERGEEIAEPLAIKDHAVKNAVHEVL